MVIAVTPNQKRDYIRKSERDLPIPQQTVFELRSVPFSVRSQFGVMLGFAAKKEGGDPLAGIGQENINRLYVLAIRTCLVGWRNFRDASGNEVKFTSQNVDVCGVTIRGAATDEALELLDTETLAELGTECLAGMVVNRDDVLS